MIFSTYWFICFCAVFYALYWVLRAPVLRLGWLVVACFVFHAHFAGAAGVLPIILLGILTYCTALSRNRIACLATIAVCVVALCFYKYTEFFCNQLLALVSKPMADSVFGAAKRVLPAAPPLAVSFFTFEFVHYLYDVQKGKEPLRNPVHFTLFAFFFPTLVAGPIKRFEQFVPALQQGVRSVSRDDVAIGLLRLAVGYVKKMVLADNITAYIEYTDDRFISGDLPWIERWLFFIMLALRIYFDFSGYSDMAIGLSRMAGIRVPENFNWPYVATSIQTFWQRWHISLSTWIRDYVYIPLGGSRHGVLRKVFNGFAAFALCGLWHGPAWNFVFWGVYHGAGLAAYNLIADRLEKGPKGKFFAVVSHPVVAWGITQFFVWIGWLYFFYPVPVASFMLMQLFWPWKLLPELP